MEAVTEDNGISIPNAKVLVLAKNNVTYYYLTDRPFSFIIYLLKVGVKNNSNSFSFYFVVLTILAEVTDSSSSLKGLFMATAVFGNSNNVPYKIRQETFPIFDCMAVNGRIPSVGLVADETKTDPNLFYAFFCR